MFAFYHRLTKMAAGISALIFFITFSVIEGGNYFSSCKTSFCDWDISVGADYLYWKPCTNDLKYVGINGGEEDSGQTIIYDVRGICPDREGGCRVKVEAFQSCGSSFGFAGSFTHLDSSKSDNVIDDSIVPVFAHPLYNQLLNNISEITLDFQEAAGNWDAEYNQWDFGVVFRMNWERCHFFKPFLGIGGLHFDEHFDAQFVVDEDTELGDVSAFTVASLELTGVGMKIGLDYRYAFCNGFQFFTFANGTVLVSDTESSVKFGTREGDGSVAVEFPNINFIEKEGCAFIPGYHLGLGLSYTGCLCGCEFFLNIGYEFTSWHHIPDPRLFVEGLDGVGENQNLSNFGISRAAQSRAISYHGASFGGGVIF